MDDAEPAGGGDQAEAADHGRPPPDPEVRRCVRRHVVDAAGARLRRRGHGLHRARPPPRPDVPASVATRSLRWPPRRRASPRGRARDPHAPLGGRRDVRRAGSSAPIAAHRARHRRRGVPGRRDPARRQGDARGRRRVPVHDPARSRGLGEAGLHLAERDLGAGVRDLVHPDQALCIARRAPVQPGALPSLPARAPLRLGDPDRDAPWAAGGGRPGARALAADRCRRRLDDPQLRQPQRGGGRVAGQPGPLLRQLPAPVRARRLDDRPHAEHRAGPPCPCHRRNSRRAVRGLRGAQPVQLLRPPRRVRADSRQAGARGAGAARRPAPRPRLRPAPDCHGCCADDDPAVRGLPGEARIDDGARRGSGSSRRSSARQPW